MLIPLSMAYLCVARYESQLRVSRGDCRKSVDIGASWAFRSRLRHMLGHSCDPVSFDTDELVGNGCNIDMSSLSISANNSEHLNRAFP